MNLADWLKGRGLLVSTIEELLPLIPEEASDFSFGWFSPPQQILNSERWFHWPGQSRFVFVGQCPDGSGIAIDSTVVPGAVFYVSPDAIGTDPSSGEFTVQVADSPAQFALYAQADNFPVDYYEAI